MPLPGNGPLSLQGQGQPGDPLYSKPKRAMLVRMSAETFEALEGFPNQPKMEFEFGEHTGVHIGDSFFAMRPLAENTPHELYLRASSAAKPMAPLKLYANVTGKFTVERQLESVQHKMRDSTLAAEKQRSERKAILLDTPPEAPRAGTKKRKEPQVLRRPVQVSDSHHSSSTTTQSMASPRPSSADGGEQVASARTRLIHCVALAPRTMEEVLKMVVGPYGGGTTRKDIMNILEEVAEKVPSAKGSDALEKWQLKTESWREVRPYSWAKLATSERTQLARQARAAFSRLKIPESDPIWEHARYRETVSIPGGTSKGVPAAGSLTEGGKLEPKRPMMPKETKQKKAKAESTRKRPSDIIVAKDESARPLKDVAKGKERAVPHSPIAPESPASAIPPSRRLPGSGFRVKASATPPAMPASPSTGQPQKRTGPVDARERREALPSGPARAAPPIPPPSTAQIRKPVKALTSSAQTKSKASPSPAIRVERVPNKKRVADASSTTTEKVTRRTREATYSSDSEEYDRPQKRRKTEERVRPKKEEEPQEKLKVRGRDRDRDVSIQKRAIERESSLLDVPRPKIKKEPSPVGRIPSSRHERELATSPSSSSRSEQSQHLPISAKPRRKSPIYTSSDEGSDRGNREDQRRRVVEKDPPRKKKQAAFKVRPLPHDRVELRHLPHDRVELRQYYKRCFRRYIKMYNEKVARTDKLERMLAQGDGSEDASDSESDIDMENLSPDVIAAFVGDLQAVIDEMERIKQAWTKLGGKIDDGELVDN